MGGSALNILPTAVPCQIRLTTLGIYSVESRVPASEYSWNADESRFGLTATGARQNREAFPASTGKRAAPSGRDLLED